ncbi:MAG: redoxin domain-containing protein [Deltaproteobacteria bacterium]|nr:redoxin domain-containing protein [Deltaproteobacteria bacterium]
MKNIKSQNKRFIVFFVSLFAVLLLPLSSAYPKDVKLDNQFKSLGIIRLAGIAPPAGHDFFDMDGKLLRLSDFKGKIVLLNFWTTWCPECVYEMPIFEKLHKKINNKGLIILAVDLKESQSKVIKFIKKHKITFKIAMNKKGDMGRAFGIRSIPTTFILNREGGLIGRAMGARRWDSQKSIDLFEYLLKNF